MRAANRAMRARGARSIDEVPSDQGHAWGAGELCSLRTIAGGFGNPARVPITMTIQPHVSVVDDLQPVVGQGRAQDVLAQVFATLHVVRGDCGRTLKVEACMLAT
jgi:hypothetical protein